MFKKKQLTAYLFTDGAIGNGHAPAATGAVLRDARGRIIAVAWRRLPAMTNNEAEYAALLHGLELARQHNIQIVHCFLDSEIVVGQMQGKFSVHSPRLRTWHQKAVAASRVFRQMTLTAIPRERNKLADALANEVYNPWPPSSAPAHKLI